MEGSLQDKLLQHEIVPPPTVWEKISLQLDEQFIPSDTLLSAKMESAAIVPPSGAWDNIAATLHPQRTKVIPLVYRRIAVAAAVLGLIALSAVYLLNNNNADPATVNRVAVNDKNNDTAVVPAPPASMQSFSSIDTAVAPSSTLTAGNTSKRPNLTRVAPPRQGNTIATEPPYLTYAELEMDPAPVQTVMDLQRVEVEAPPIRDARGNIIMDYSVITNPDDPYVTITSPSGIQTRISTKFLHCLRYMNGDFSVSEINPEGRQWKNRFEEWRNKLLSEGAFVPAANNFFDIFELKALIEEQ